MAASASGSSMPEGVKRIFVVGANGQVAQAVARTYAARGDCVICAGRESADVTDRSAVTSAITNFQPDLVVNAAAYTAVDRAEDEAEQAFLVNRDGSANVASAARTAGAPLIHISTDYVFDGLKTSPYMETDQTNPASIYGASKLAGESAVAAATDCHVILRTSWVCSPYGNNFVKTMLRLAGQRDEISVVDDQWGAPTFAADLAVAICAVGEKLLATHSYAGLTGIYHVTCAGETTWCRFARAIMSRSAEKCGPACRVRPIATSEYPTRAKRPANSRLNCSKLAQVFGIRLPPWEKSLDICLDQLINTSQRVST